MSGRRELVGGQRDLVLTGTAEGETGGPDLERCARLERRARLDDDLGSRRRVEAHPLRLSGRKDEALLSEAEVTSPAAHHHPDEEEEEGDEQCLEEKEDLFDHRATAAASSSVTRAARR